MVEGEEVEGSYLFEVGVSVISSLISIISDDYESGDVFEWVDGDGVGEQLMDFFMGNSVGSGSGLCSDEDFEFQNVVVEMLVEYLLWQLNLFGFDLCQCVIVVVIIDVFNLDGYFIENVEVLLVVLLVMLQVSEEEFEVVCCCVQIIFDLVGVVSSDLCDCLCVQLEQFDLVVMLQCELVLCIVDGELDLLV